ncbi:MAG: CPBP family intramembrane metalloprotease [Flavobacteriales bacterium]|nr:CPBP family intramembrane metalloprotease [Flavobacteriales bacterium]
MIAAPLAITGAVANLLGWSDVLWNIDIPGSQSFWISAAIVLFFEAIPEEFAFRGYLYGKGLQKMNAFKASALSILLFVALPVATAPIQGLLFDSVYVGGHSQVTGGYLITMFFFAVFQQFLRYHSGSIWTGIGFHFSFVYLLRYLGPESSDIIQLTGDVQQGPLQVVLPVGIILGFAAVLWFYRKSRIQKDIKPFSS